MAKKRIFLSYRREDSADASGRIYDRLADHFGEAAIFKDVDDIPFGVNFRTYLGQMVEDSVVELVVIGPEWLRATNSAGERRLDDPSDFVRIEIEVALERGIPVIPLLVRGSRMSPADSLPPELIELAYRNGIEVRADPDFHRDMDRLIRGLEDYLAPSGEPGAGEENLSDEEGTHEGPALQAAAAAPEIQEGGLVAVWRGLPSIVERVWRPAVIAAAGWGLGYGLGAVLSGETGGTGGWLFTGAVGGFVTFLVLRYARGSVIWRQAVTASAGWAIASAALWGAMGFLGESINFATGYGIIVVQWYVGIPVGWAIGWLAFGALGSLAYSRWKPVPGPGPLLRIAVTWLLAGLLGIGLSLVLEGPIEAVASVLLANNLWEMTEAISTFLVWTTAGMLGTGGMAWLLRTEESRLDPLTP